MMEKGKWYRRAVESVPASAAKLQCILRDPLGSSLRRSLCSPGAGLVMFFISGAWGTKPEQYAHVADDHFMQVPLV